MPPALSPHPEPAVHHGLLRLHEMREEHEQVLRGLVVREVQDPDHQVLCLPLGGAGPVRLVPGLWTRGLSEAHPGLDGGEHLLSGRLWSPLSVPVISIVSQSFIAESLF